MFYSETFIDFNLTSSLLVVACAFVMSLKDLLTYLLTYLLTCLFMGALAAAFSAQYVTYLVLAVIL